MRKMKNKLQSLIAPCGTVPIMGRVHPFVLVRRAPFPSAAVHAFFISTSAISTSRLRIGQKISTFCAPPMSLAFVKYQFSNGYFMIYCEKKIIHL